MMTTISNKAYESVIDSYNKETLSDIAHYGCISGCATEHVYYHQTTKFYDEHEEEILMFLNDVNYTTDNCLTFFGGDAQDIKQLKNNLTWAFVEAVAQEYTLENET